MVCISFLELYSHRRSYRSHILYHQNKVYHYIIHSLEDNLNMSRQDHKLRFRLHIQGQQHNLQDKLN